MDNSIGHNGNESDRNQDISNEIKRLINEWDSLPKQTIADHIRSIKKVEKTVRRVAKRIRKPESTLRRLLKNYPAVQDSAPTSTFVNASSSDAFKAVLIATPQIETKKQGPQLSAQTPVNGFQIDFSRLNAAIAEEKKKQELLKKLLASSASPPLRGKNKRVADLVDAFKTAIQVDLGWQTPVQLMELVQERLTEREIARKVPRPAPAGSDPGQVIRDCRPHEVGLHPLEVAVDQLAVALFRLAPERDVRSHVVAKLLHCFHPSFPEPEAFPDDEVSVEGAAAGWK